ncbi:hypothetical protein N7414_24515 [Pseudomonas sp. GD04087]|uniref:hypothetical protein n=1 Tax=unclassified Pseudomonas TaxID=196821 RepID=UPI00244BC0C3|nr:MULTISPECIES: hypothetical protein [unclassified Pseudomonas]MDH0292302.1 hypothetical protein [Pseudomonas sp. GD04087]MDH1050455.1 hypothetical protein [Pseudomonas sp. GD03903]MDH2002650.1 hypothetical protein [Pseudomonas sp. GD03691]
MQKYWWWGVPCLALLGVALLYWPINSLGYVWDDTTLFLDSPLLRNPENIWVSLSTQLLPGTTYFRPVVLLTFILEFKIFGVRPDVSHGINYGIFLVNCVLVFLLAWRVGRARGARARMLRATLAGLLYGCNPVLLESAAWVSGRFDLLVTAFVLLGLLSLSCFHGVVRNIIVSAVFLLAVCSKEMAITFPVLVVIWLWLEQTPDKRGWARFNALWVSENRSVLFCLAAAFCSYLAMRLWIFDGLYNSDSSLGGDIVARSAFVGQTIWFYVHMAIWPFSDLSPIHPFDPNLMTTTQRAMGVSILLIFIGTLALMALRGGRVALILLCGLISLAPVLNIAPLLISGNIGQERFLTLPVAFLALALTQLNIVSKKLSDAMQRALPWLVSALVCIWVALGALNVHLNAPLWGSEESLWAWAYEKVPESDYVRFNYVASLLFYQREEQAERMLEEFEKGASGLSNRLKALKGQMLVRKKRYQEGLALLDAGLVGEYKPHEDIIRKGIDINKTEIVVNGYASSWYLRFVYGAKAEAYLYLEDYDELNKSLDIMNFYDSSYAVIPMYRAFGAYAQGDIALGDRLFAESISKFSKPVGESAYGVRVDFFNRFCETRSSLLMCRERESILSSHGG